MNNNIRVYVVIDKERDNVPVIQINLEFRKQQDKFFSFRYIIEYHLLNYKQPSKKIVRDVLTKGVFCGYILKLVDEDTWIIPIHKRKTTYFYEIFTIDSTDLKEYLILSLRSGSLSTSEQNYITLLIDNWENIEDFSVED